MQSKDVQIGQTYWAKISKRSVKARIESVNPHGGWNATNLNTGRQARIKSAVNLDEIIEGNNVWCDRQLKKQQEQARVNQNKAEVPSDRKTDEVNASPAVKQQGTVHKVQANDQPKRTRSNILDIKPKTKENIKAIRIGTKQEKIARLLINGASIADLEKVTGWTRNSCQSALREDMHNRKGYGIRQENNQYFLVFPDGLNDLIVSGGN